MKIHCADQTVIGAQKTKREIPDIFRPMISFSAFSSSFSLILYIQHSRLVKKKTTHGKILYTATKIQVQKYRISQLHGADFHANNSTFSLS